MSEEYELELSELTVQVDTRTRLTHRGARSSLGVPEEPDEYETGYQIVSVYLLDVDMTKMFDDGEWYGDEGELDEHLERRLKEVMKEY